MGLLLYSELLFFAKLLTSITEADIIKPDITEDDITVADRAAIVRSDSNA